MTEKTEKRRWSATDLADLARLYASNTPIETISTTLNRTVRAILLKLINTENIAKTPDFTPWAETDTQKAKALWTENPINMNAIQDFLEKTGHSLPGLLNHLILVGHIILDQHVRTEIILRSEQEQNNHAELEPGPVSAC